MAIGSPRKTGGFPWNTLSASRLSGNPLLGVTGDGDKRFEVIETERGAIAPGAGLILERTGEGRREERALLAGVLPDRRLDAAASQLVRGIVVGIHLCFLLC